MHYEGEHIIRPPSEANSIILQVTVGCSHNRCTFCGTYKAERFRLKDDAVVQEDLAFASRYCRRQSRLFLADGDVLILPQHRLVRLLVAIREQLPWVNRVSLYGNAKAVRSKSVAELRELKELGLDRVYMGLESGHDPTLAAIRKGVDSAAMIAAGQRVREADLFFSVTALLGIAGEAQSLAHAEATGKVLSAMAPNQIGILTLMLLPNTPLYAEAEAGRFRLPDQTGLLRELRVMVEHLNLTRSQLMSNHASNYLPINARLPKDKGAVLATIDQALAGAMRLKPEYLRGL
ncbi:MAG: radical SAM protein [Thermodesulfobacteriota bacterium]